MACTGACRALSASADNYVVFFLAGLGAYYGAAHFLTHGRVLRFIKALSASSLNQRITFTLIACLMGAAWLVALEYAIQFYVPEFQISNLAGFPVAFLILLGLGLLSLYIQDNFIAWRIAAAIFMPMFQVAALHFYIISSGDFRQCIPLPMLYVLIPAVLAAMTWKHIAPLVTGCPVTGHSSSRIRRTHHVHRSPAARREPPPQDARFDYADFNWNYVDNPLMMRNDLSCSSNESYR
ncbi:hypothetical protein BV898_16005 [Hypsibius exemplaris]|uniref:Uncharacterized protein n=1 Tax=Hypsibius exemplaris TaxID=2072580 RepID=A0A9X6NEZ8_HYPEX|nr:hypothetical protein BV898_16005 [Hypsibius exemplaris]